MAQQFTCVPLSAIPRVHNFAASSPSVHFLQKLVIASKFQIAVAVANNHELAAFRTTVAHELSSGAFNDVNKVQTKVTSLDAQWEIVSIGLNADETLLGVFANNQHGCFVHIYDVITLSVDVSGEAVPLCSVRVGNTASKGIAFEWNPALSDMFAASDNERTLSVAKIDMQNPSKYSLLGEKKLEANINEISWSPKGKQLVAGDANGKIFQLKPETELVRATNAPQNGLAVTSLSWLATTEWLVAYSNPERTSGGTFILNIKKEKKLNRLDRGNIYAVIKDKPPSWTPVDLAGQFSLGETRRLLVDWNIVVVVLPGTGQLLGVCKPPNANAWSTVPLASLPQPSPASFVIGIAVDLSRQTSVTLGDGSTRRLPALVALNSDGSLRSFQLSPPSKEYPDCNVSLVAVDPNKIQRGLRPAVLATTQNVPSLTPASAAAPQQSATPIAGLFAKMGEQKAPTAAFPSGSTSGGLFAGAKATTQSPLSSGTTTISTSIFSTQPSGTASGSALGASQTTPKSSLTQPSSNLLSGASLPLFGKPATGPTLTQTLSAKPEALAQPPPAPVPLQEVQKTGPAPVPLQEVQKTGPDPAEAAKAAKAALAAARISAKENVEKFRKVWHDSHRDLHSFSINKQKAELAISEAVASLTHAENSETADEIHRMVCELDEELSDLMRMVVEKKELIEEKTATHKECRDIELSYRRPLDPLERTQSDSVMQKFEDFTIKLHEAKKLIAETKKVSVASKPRRVSEFDPKFEGRLYESMKNMARYFAIVRSRVDDVERKALHFTTRKQLNSTTATADPSLSTLTATDTANYDEAPSSIFITSAPKPLYFDRGASKSQQRAKMLEIMAAKKDIKTMTKKVELLRIDGGASDDTLSSSFLNAPNLETSLYQKISSPHTVKQVQIMRNASTQADAPPATASTLTHTPSVTSALSSLSKQPASTVGDIPKSTSDKTLSTSTIVPLATSTPGFKLGDSSLKPSGSLFSSANPITPPSVNSQEATSKLAKEVNSLGGKSIFGALQSATKTTVPPTESKPLFAFSTLKTTTEATNESKPSFGGLGTAGSLNPEKKDLGKQSTLFGALNEKASTATSEKNEEKKSSLFGGTGATTSVAAEKKDEKQITFGNKAAAESTVSESKETKPTSLFGGAAKQTAATSIFGGGTLSKPLSFPSAPLAKPSETLNEKDQKDENSATKSSEVKQPEAKLGLEPSLASSALTATTTATTTASSSIFGKSPIIPSTAATTTTSSLFGTSSISSSTPATTTTATTSSSLFGTISLSSSTPATTATTTTSSLFGTTSIISTAPTTTTTTTTSSSIFGSLKNTTAQSSAFGSVFGAKGAGSTQGSAAGANAVTFSFKPKTETEAAQPTASFTFTPKPSSGGSLGFAAAAAAAASSTDNDEGMDDDGAAGGASQSSGGSIFGGGFMSGIGSTTSANANKNVFGMGTSNLLKNASTQPGSSSLFKTGQPSIFGGNTQTSSFATAAQQAAQSNTSPSSSMSKSVFGAAPKFGGPPVFGAKPVFGSPTTQQATAFGGASATGGGFSSFSGNKSLFGGATSGGSSLFGGGTTTQNQPKSSLFGGGQPSSSFSTWR